MSARIATARAGSCLIVRERGRLSVLCWRWSISMRTAVVLAVAATFVLGEARTLGVGNFNKLVLAEVRRRRRSHRSPAAHHLQHA